MTQTTVQGTGTQATSSVKSASPTVAAPKPASSIAITNSPGTLQEASLGAGVNFVEQIAATGLSTVYAAVRTASGALASGWTAVAVNNGKASVSVHLAHAGDYVDVVDNATLAMVEAKSGAVAITEPPLTIGNPGTLVEAKIGAGASYTAHITATSGATVREAVFTASGTQETAWTTVALNAGTADVAVHLARTGDYVEVLSSDGRLAIKSGAVAVIDPSITVSAPGTIQEAAPGAGVNVSAHVAATGLATVYEAVRTASGALETGWTAVAVNNGTATVNAHLAHTGDFIDVVNNATLATVEGKSAAVTITEPPISVSAPGTVRETTVGGGVTITEQFTAPNLKSINAAVRTASGALETAWTTIAVNNGTASASFHLAHTGDYIEAFSNTGTSFDAKSAAVTITEPTLAVSNPGTLQEAALGAGVNYNATITGVGVASASEAVFTASGTQETAWSTVALNTGTATVAVHLAHAGDYVEVVNTVAKVQAKSAAVTITERPAISLLNNPGTVRETTLGGGVNVVEQIAATGLSTVYEAVRTASGALETGWTAVAVNNGTATASAHLAHTGDYVDVVDNTTLAAVEAKSAAVTITSPTLAVSNPGTLQEAALNAGVNYTATITGTGLTTANEAVFTASGTQETPWTSVALNTGTVTVAVHLAHAGDYVEVVNTAANVQAVSSGVTVTEWPTITLLNNPGTIQEAALGAGVNVAEQVSATGLSTVYEAVRTASGALETGWTAVAFSNGAANVSVHFAHTGDYLDVVDNTSSATLEAKSAAVTITERPTLAFSNAPGTIQESAVGAGVNFTGQVAATGLTTVYEAVRTASGILETGWTAVAVNNGKATASAHLAHTGDYLDVVDNTSSATVEAKSAAVTITEPTINFSNAPGTVQESAVGAGVNFTGQVAVSGLNTVYTAVRTASGALETGWIAVTVNNGTANVSAHLAHTGDYVDVVDNTASTSVEARSTAVTITEPTITQLTAPGSIQESAVGTGVTFVERVGASGLATVYEAVRTASGALETGWTAVAVNNGTATVSVHLAHTGDYLDVVDNTFSATVETRSAAVTITEPPTLAVSNTPGAIQEATVGAGVNFTGQVAVSGLNTVYAAVRTASGSLETGWTAVAVNNGNATVSAHLAHTGDYLDVVDNTFSATVEAKSGAVIITERPTITFSNAPGTIQEATTGAGVNFTGQVAVTGLNIVYEAVRTASGALETGWTNVIVSNGTATVSAHLAHTGDYIDVVDSTASATVDARSGAVTITAAPTLSVTSPGTLSESSLGAGVDFTAIVGSTGLANATVYSAVFTASGNQETGWSAVSLNGNGQALVSAHLAHAGDTLEISTSANGGGVQAISGALSIAASDFVVTDTSASAMDNTTSLSGVGTTGTLDLQGLSMDTTSLSMAGGAATVDGVAVANVSGFTCVNDSGSVADLNVADLVNGQVIAGIGNVFVTTTGGINSVDFSQEDASSADTLVSGGNTTATGGAGTLSVTQTGGSLLLTAGAGAIAFQGGQGTAVVQGSTGNDTFAFGSGTATVTGNGGSDAYSIDASTDPSTAVSTITDFNAIQDTINLTGVSYQGLLTALAGQVSDGAGGTLVTFANGAALHLAGIATAQATFFQTADGPLVFNDGSPAFFAANPGAGFLMPRASGELDLVGLLDGATSLNMDGAASTVDGAAASLLQGFTRVDFTKATGAASLTASNVVAATVLGGAGALTITGGQATLTVVAGAGAINIAAGAGTLDFTGLNVGAGVIEFNHGTGGMAVLRNLGQGEHVMLAGFSQDEVAQAVLSQASDGQGGSILSLDDGATLDFTGRATVAANLFQQADGTAFGTAAVVTDAYAAEAAANPALLNLSSTGTGGVLLLQGLTQGATNINLSGGSAQIDGVNGVSLGTGFTDVDASGSTASLTVAEGGNIANPVTVQGGNGNTTVGTAAGGTTTIDLTSASIAASTTETVTSAGQDTILGGNGALSLTQASMAGSQAPAMTFIGGIGQATVATGAGTSTLTGGLGNLAVQAGNGGNTTILAGPGTLDFTDAGNGGSTTIGFTLGKASLAIFENLTGSNSIQLKGFMQGDLDNAVASQQGDGSGGTVLSFSDLTTMDFVGKSSVTESQFRLA